NGRLSGYIASHARNWRGFACRPDQFTPKDDRHFLPGTIERHPAGLSGGSVKKLLRALTLLTLCSFGGFSVPAQDGTVRLRIQVVLVELDVAVTDSKGNYISVLKPEDFVVLEDNTPQKIMTFEEGVEAPRILAN